MIDKLKACFYILLAKQYVVFTADRENAYKRAYAEIYGANKAFLAAVVSYIRDVAERHAKESNELLNEIDNEQRND